MRPVVLLALLGALLVLLPASAGATEVAYSDGGQVWVSTLDGSARRQLPPAPDDGKAYREVAQSDDGHVLGVRRAAGANGQFNTTRLWAPDGAVAGDGTLTPPAQGWGVYAYPVTLDLTPDGKVVVFGYSLSRFTGQYEFKAGTAGMTSSGQYTAPVDITPNEAGTLAGTRLLAVQQSTQLATQDTGPFGRDFSPWLQAQATILRADLSANGKVLALELQGQAVDRQVAMLPMAGPGSAAPSDGSDCFLDTSGPASDVSIAPDGLTMAWHDDRGVVVAGTPAWFPSADVSLCRLSSPPVVVSATGAHPSLGASTAATPAGAPAGGGSGGGGGGTATAPPAAPSAAPAGGVAGATGAGTAPRAKAPAVVKAAALGKGVRLVVTAGGKGRVTATGKVGRTTVATGAAIARHAGRVTLRLRATRAQRRKLRRLRGKTMRVTVRAPGGTVVLIRRLR